jgi:hypothetical protein
MPPPSILVAKWDNRLFSVTGKMVHQELVDQSVRSLVADGRGRVLTIVGGIGDSSSLSRCDADRRPASCSITFHLRPTYSPGYWGTYP